MVNVITVRASVKLSLLKDLLGIVVSLGVLHGRLI